MNHALPKKHRRGISTARVGGATLMELLAVIIIMTMLAAAAMPVIAPAMQNRQVREASRIVNGFLSGARNRAMQTGRPVGVVFERMQGLPEACVTMSYAEVPPPYAGDSIGSTALLSGNGITALTPLNDPMTGNLIGSQDIGWIGTVRQYDLIKFNYIGDMFPIRGAVSTASGSPVTIQPDPAGYFTATGMPGPNCYWMLGKGKLSGANPPSGGNLKYQIFRAPIRMAAGSVQLPGTAVIDLTCSGFDNPTTPIPMDYNNNPVGNPIGIPWISSQSFQPLPQSIPGVGNVFQYGLSDTSSVTLTFGPSGAVDWVWCWPIPFIPYVVPSPSNTHHNPVPLAFRPSQPIHLMIGRRELLPLPTALPAITDPTVSGFQPFLNWQDVGNYWVTISPQSGLVTTNEVVQSTFNVVPGTPPQYGVYGDLWGSRQLARQAHAMGGR
ncbi:MAG TPA: hypothetical protein VGJ26_03755 [Pirellulales bacterium]|jgi:type II secretory pathway pseudopilin PulG